MCSEEVRPETVFNLKKKKKKKKKKKQKKKKKTLSVCVRCGSNCVR